MGSPRWRELAGRVSAGNWGVRGLNVFFFWGRESHQAIFSPRYLRFLLVAFFAGSGWFRGFLLCFVRKFQA